MGKYLRELVTRSKDPSEIRWELLSDRPDLPIHLPHADNIAVDRFEMRGFRFHTWEQLALPARARATRPDVLHCPGGRLPWWQPVPTVVTLHDAMPWVLDEAEWPAGWYRDGLTPRALAKTAAIITVSESSRKDIATLWPHLAEKIHVIPNGVGDEYLEATPAPVSSALQEAGIRQPYLLYMGAEIPRKRLNWALQTFASIADTGVDMVVCGVDQPSASLLGSLAPGTRSRVHFVPFVAEVDMPALYRNAVAVLYPTTYEGFGLPALEAQAVGTPVLFGDVKGLSELNGPGAYVLPPLDFGAWVETARSVIEQRRHGGRPDERSRAWARRFSWDACAARTLAIYSEVAARRSELTASRAA